jgi:hypothetical protein
MAAPDASQNGLCETDSTQRRAPKRPLIS